jgi:glutathione S-transferase
MADSTVRLVMLPISPFSERARWALDHHRIDYESIVHVPFIGERRLRRLVGTRQARVTAPALLLPDRVLTQSWDIAEYADAHGHSSRLLPADRMSDVQHYNDLADRTMEAGRALVTRALLASPAALEETLPPGVPRFLRPWLRPLSRYGARWFARKYELRLDEPAASIAAVRAALEILRAGLAQSPRYLLGSLSYADIVMAVSLQAVAPVPDRYIRLGPATRQVWSQPELAAEFADLITWRDALYERHRAKRQPAARRAPAEPRIPSCVPGSTPPAGRG